MFALRFHGRFLVICCAMLCTVSARASAQETIRMPVEIDGEHVSLSTQIYRPVGKGPFPTLIFHHGSTYRGTKPQQFAMVFDPKPMAEWFVAHGWAVVLPSRRGRGGSDGVYDEGFAEDRDFGYSCSPARSIPGADRALRDIDAATDLILKMTFVDATQVVVGGHSRGGILSIAHAGRNPDMYRGVLNFVGGWVGEDCNHVIYKSAPYIDRLLMGRGTTTALPMLWLYAENDSYCSEDYYRRNFEVFINAGGHAEYRQYTLPKRVDGHALVFFPKVWGGAVEHYLAARGLPVQAGETRMAAN